MNQIDLAGKTAVITGGTRGIGLAIVERMVKSGARVTVWDRERIEEGSKAAAAGATLIAVDVANADAVSRALAETEQRVGPLDILVNSAAIGGLNTTVAQYPVDEWRAVIDVHLNGSFYVARAAAAHFKSQDAGAYVHMTSTSGLVGNLGQANYSAAKLGIVGLSKSIALDMAKYHVRSNCIAPKAGRRRRWRRMQCRRYARASTRSSARRTSLAGTRSKRLRRDAGWSTPGARSARACRPC